MSRHSAAALGSYRGTADRDEEKAKGNEGESCRGIVASAGTWLARLLAVAGVGLMLGACTKCDVPTWTPASAAAVRFPATATLPRAKILPPCKVTSGRQRVLHGGDELLERERLWQESNWPCSGRCFWKASSA